LIFFIKKIEDATLVEGGNSRAVVSEVKKMASLQCCKDATNIIPSNG